jgi:hypothetical protein
MSTLTRVVSGVLLVVGMTGLRSERSAADDVRGTAVRAKRRGLALRERDLRARFAEQPRPLTLAERSARLL